MNIQVQLFVHVTNSIVEMFLLILKMPRSQRELSRSYEARIKQLEQELSVYKSEVTKVESNLAEALAAKNSEIETLVSSIDALKKQAALSEGNLASLQVGHVPISAIDA